MKDDILKSIKKLSLASNSLQEQKRREFQKLLPGVFRDGQLDVDALCQAIGGEPQTVDGLHAASSRGESFGLNWAGKAEALQALQTPSKATLRPSRDESIDFDSTQNLFIEGDNLEVLKLLQNSYRGQVKMIYIDPPYNTGKEFIYPDNYKEGLDAYLHYTGQKNKNGATTTNIEKEGRLHSKWLSMMYPRLYLAHTLLRDDGVMFISIDDHEQANLRKIGDEIFGEYNFIGTVLWHSTKSYINTALVSSAHTYNLCWAKNYEYFKQHRGHFRLPDKGEGFKNPDQDPQGPWKADPFQVGGWRPNQQYTIANPKTKKTYTPRAGCSWRNDDKKFKHLMREGRIVFGAAGEAGPQVKRYLFEAQERGQVSSTWWDDVDTTSKATQDLKQLFDGYKVFSYPKPVNLIKKMIQLGDHRKKGIVLDFFAGSSPVAQATMELNAEDGGARKFICVQLPEPLNSNDKENEEAYKFCQKFGVAPTLSALSLERIKRAAANIKKDMAAALDLGVKAFKLAPSCFKHWDEGQAIVGPQQLAARIQNQVDYLDAEASQQDILYEIMLKSGVPLDTPLQAVPIGKRAASKTSMQAPTQGSSAPCLDSMSSAPQVYSFKSNKLLVCVEPKLSYEFIESLLQRQPLPEKVIFLDSSFASDDELKVNALHLFKTRSSHTGQSIDFCVV